MSRVVVVFVLVLATCLLMAQDVEGKKRMSKKSSKRRMYTVVKDLENNVTALWSEVKMLSQPVHVHLHGDGRVMDSDHAHNHHESSHEDPKSPGEEEEEEGVDVEVLNDDKKHDRSPHHDRRFYRRHHGHGHHDDDDGDGDGKKKMKSHHQHHSRHEDKMAWMKKKKMMMMMGGGHGHPEDEEEEWEEWKEKYHNRKGTHVHIHLHTGAEEEEEGERRHALPPLPQEYRHACCYVVPNSAQPAVERDAIMGGTIFFRQMPNSPLEAKLNIAGFPFRDRHNNYVKHLRGLHGHEYGDMTNGCNSLGGHMNPHGVSHGGPDAEHRHTGDFGNIEVDENGSARTSFTDDVASLFGYDSMMGKSMVIHSGADDLGHGESEASKGSGNAGGRSACCIIVACPEPAGVWTSEDDASPPAPRRRSSGH